MSPSSEQILPAEARIYSTYHTESQPQSIDETIIHTNNEVLQFSVRAEGHNWGWLPSNDVESKPILAFWGFRFTPSESRYYKLTALMWFGGHYILYADDTALTSKEATAEIKAGFSRVQNELGDPTATYFTDLGYNYTLQTVFQIGDDNIDVNNNINDTEIISTSAPYLEKDIEVALACYARVYTYARGGGSVSEMNFTGTGNGIACPFLIVD